MMVLQSLLVNLLTQSPSVRQDQKIRRQHMGHDSSCTNPETHFQFYTYCKLGPGGLQYGPEAVTFLS